MSLQHHRMPIRLSVPFVAIALCTPLRADSVTLNSGGTVHGNLVTAAATNGVKSVALMTTTGALLIIDKDAVKQVKHGGDAGSKASAAKSASKKQQPTAAEKAWTTRVRTLLKRLESDNPNASRKTRGDLLAINDPNAIPAVTHYLQKNANPELRRLYVAILGNIRGARAVYFLVDQSLFDPSGQVRDDARKAIGDDRADMARPLYIHAMRLGDADLASRAALGIAEIGDPRGESVTYLIDSLVMYVSKLHQIVPSGIAVTDMVTIYTTPGFAPGIVPGATYVGQTGGSSTMPVYLGPSGMSQAQINQAIANLKPATPSSMRGPQAMPQNRGSGTYYITPAVADTYAAPIFGRTEARYSKAPVRTENPHVLDTLIKVTAYKPGFGYNADNWRRWWAAEKKSRDLQKQPDRVVPKSRPEPR
jgi:HEAT repeats